MTKIPQSASTIEHEISMSRMVHSNLNKRERERSSGVYDASKVKRSIYLKAASSDNRSKKKTPDATVSRTLRKNNFN